MKEHILLLNEGTRVGYVSGDMKCILEIICREEHPGVLGPKIKMIKALRVMSKMADPENVWGLKSCKDYVEANWRF